MVYKFDNRTNLYQYNFVRTRCFLKLWKNLCKSRVRKVRKSGTDLQKREDFYWDYPIFSYDSNQQNNLDKILKLIIKLWVTVWWNYKVGFRQSLKKI